MDALKGDLSRKVFRRLIKGGLGEYSLDAQMIAVLVELDGAKTVGEIAERAKISPDVMRRVLSKLLQLQIIEPVEKAVSTLDQGFLSLMKRELSLAIGPIAEVIMEDAAADLGHDLESFPAEQAAELVDYVSQEITREDRKIACRQNMAAEIRRRGL
ncbi:MAG: hypothetical protein JRI97_09165 [Deltaproteobacteria bacterium]|nr:hypothetical protein [Deltaproteobacteria bacterium]